MKKTKTSILSFGKASYNWMSIKILINLISVGLTVVFIDRICYLISSMIAKTLTNQSLKTTIIILVSVLIAKLILPWFTNKAVFKISSKIKISTRKRIFSKLLELELDYTEHKKTGGIISTAVEGVESIETFYGLFFPQIFLSVLVPIGLFIYLRSLDPVISLVLLLGVPLIPISVGLVQAWVQRVAKMHWSTYEDLNSFYLESIQGITTLKSFGLIEKRQEKIAQKSWDFRNRTMKLLFANLTSILTMDIIAMVGTALGITLAILRFPSLGLQASLVVLLISYEFFRPLRQLGSYFHFAINGISAMKSIMELLKKKSKKRDTWNLFNKLIDQNTSIKFSNVFFSYRERKVDVLKGISFTAEAGKITAIVGPNGVGKSTLVNLIVRFFDPTSGKITLGDINTAHIQHENIREKVSLLSQRTTLFHGTIRDNLLIAKPNATDNELLQACQKAGIAEFINSLPEKLDSSLKEHAKNISTGQKQRIGIARALLKNAPILILDEPTANLDSENEEKIQQAIQSISKDTTTILITHHLKTIRDADKILVLADGVVKEQGTHDELVDSKGLYYELSLNQQTSNLLLNQPKIIVNQL